ncbi:MAG TPA: peptide ABC transporter substrate-binding protein [Candidatus Eremiobacteraceae bacterium]|jgi:peptide/nickel transport system substrate-binding protein
MGDLAARRSAFAFLIATAIAFAGCSKVQSGTAPSSGALPGVVRIVGIGSNDSLIPELSASASSVDIGQFWAAWFFQVNERGDLEPELATEVPTPRNGGVSADGLTITYHLRKGVTWQDGAPFTASDAIFTWHLIMDPRNNVLTREGYDDIASMSAPDPLTLRVTLKKPYAPAIATFFGPSLQPMPVLPEHLLKALPDINHAAYDNKPVGTGPFYVATFEPGTRIVLKPNPHYWRGPPKLSEVDFPIIIDANTQTTQMRTGEADLFYNPGSSQVPELRSIPGVHINTVTFNEYWYLIFNEKHPPLDDVRVRRAIAMATDRDYLIRTVMQGYATRAETDQPPFSWAFDPNVHQPAYDLAAAGRLFDEAGWKLDAAGYRAKNGAELTLTLASGTTWEDARKFAPVFQSMLQRVGVRVQIKFYPTAVLEGSAGSGGVINNGRFDLAYTAWIAGVDPDDETLWACDQHPPIGWNQSFMCDPRVDTAERIALTKYDRETRKAAYWRVQELLAQDAPVIFMYYVNRDDAVRDGFGNYRPAPAVTEFWNTWQWQMR